MKRRKVIVVTALELEARAVRRAVKGGCEVQTVGLRAAYLPRLAAEVVIVAGVAGALDPSLVAGDLVLDSPLEVKEGPVAMRRG